MKFIAMGDARTRLAEVVGLSQHDRVVLTRQGQPIAVVIGIAGLDAEQVALGLDDDLWERIERARQEPIILAEEVERRFGLTQDPAHARANRRGKSR